jgi:hypothetical protein
MGVEDILTYFPGWGIPTNSIWFIGTEEASTFDENLFRINKEYFTGVNNINYTSEEYDKELEEFIKKYYLPKEHNKDIYFFWNETDIIQNVQMKLYDNISEILSNIFKLSKEEYKFKYLAQDKDRYINKNSNIKYNSFLTNIYTSDDTESRNKRLIYLKELWEKSKPKVTICHGMDNHLDFIKIFGNNIKDLTGNGIYYKNDKYKDKRYYFSEFRKIFIINHLSRFKYIFEKEHIETLRLILL